MSELYDVLSAVVGRLNRKGWHGSGCNVHDRWETPRGFGLHGDEPDICIPGGTCDCGAIELVERVNKVLREIAPGQISLPGL